MIKDDCKSDNDKIDIDNLMDITPILFDNGHIVNPFTGSNNRIIFADDTASARPCKLIEDLIQQNIYPYYSNTHSNATCGIIMKELVNNTRKVIREYMNVRPSQKIIFTGSGCTGAVNHIVSKIAFNKYKKVDIFLTPYEHHSNYLPWIEAKKRYAALGVDIKFNIKYMEIDEDNEHNHNLNIDSLLESIDNLMTYDKSHLTIVSMTACSNVTGRKFDKEIEKISTHIKSKKESNNIYLLVDYACSSPYVKIDASIVDGLFFSGHKFLGGQSTPGVLIVNEKLMEVECPYNPGGGCVEKADDTVVIYKTDIEAKETGGTPNIVGIGRLKYCLQLKEVLLGGILNNEKLINKYVTSRMQCLLDTYSNFKIVEMTSRKEDDLPIFPISIEGLHHNLTTALLNDLFGIQTRGGISCCGTFGRICKESLHINGWTRITFNYILTKVEIDRILEGLEYVIKNGLSYKDYYVLDEKTNLFLLKSKS